MKINENINSTYDLYNAYLNKTIASESVIKDLNKQALQMVSEIPTDLPDNYAESLNNMYLNLQLLKLSKLLILFCL